MDDWTEAHPYVELMDASRRRSARLTEGGTGMARLHAMIGKQVGDVAGETGVAVEIETDRFHRRRR